MSGPEETTSSEAGKNISSNIEPTPTPAAEAAVVDEPIHVAAQAAGDEQAGAAADNASSKMPASTTVNTTPADTVASQTVTMDTAEGHGHPTAAADAAATVDDEVFVTRLSENELLAPTAPPVHPAVAALAATRDQSEVSVSQLRRGSEQSLTGELSTTSASVEPLRKRCVEDFIFGKILGEGSYSTVMLATEKDTQKLFAIKVLEKKHIIKEKKIKYVNSEKAVLNKINHPFFVKLYYTFQDSAKLYFVLNYCSRGEILDHLRKIGAFSLRCTRHYAAEITAGLEYMHGLNIIHRDLKPENILLDESWHIRITDFGTAKILDSNGQLGRQERTNSFVGTAEYVSPELLTEKTSTKLSDLWALGCIIYQFMVGKPPFKGGNEYQTFQKITKLQYEFPEGFNPDAADLVSKLLVLDVTSRVGSDASGGYLSLKTHPFFQKLDWDGLVNSTPPTLEPPEKFLTVRQAGAATMGLDQVSELPFERGPDFAPSDESDEEALIIANNTAAAATATSSNGQALTAGTSKSSNAATPTDRPSSFVETGTGVTATEQAKWRQFLQDKELVVKTGVVLKKKGLSTKKRMLILSDMPRLQYIDTEKMVVKGEIPWSSDIRAESKSSKLFLIHTPDRVYNLEDPSGGAKGWCDEINRMRR